MLCPLSLSPVSRDSSVRTRGAALASWGGIGLSPTSKALFFPHLQTVPSRPLHALLCRFQAPRPLTSVPLCSARPFSSLPFLWSLFPYEIRSGNKFECFSVVTLPLILEAWLAENLKRRKKRCLSFPTRNPKSVPQRPFENPSEHLQKLST